ncbi:hypothetical protein OIU74_002496 [Salix koriyanagi]|uniref:Uncharacterized protein n=1 Tax=Salix koriyanagi TaxID=2511006 RepID=A0A9Q0X560_9ROSI|nr:hypothetical protein OIU74_002496 [Salix koriyanagi]
MFQEAKKRNNKREPGNGAGDGQGEPSSSIHHRCRCRCQLAILGGNSSSSKCNNHEHEHHSHGDAKLSHYFVCVPVTFGLVLDDEQARRVLIVISGAVDTQFIGSSEQRVGSKRGVLYSQFIEFLLVTLT